jgi:probable phosphoglycerate mutase
VIGQDDPPPDPGAVDREQMAVGAVAALRPDRVISSNLLRARGLAEKIAEAAACTLSVRREVREQRFGLWQGRT